MKPEKLIFGLSYVLNGELVIKFVKADCEYDARMHNVPSEAELRKVWVPTYVLSEAELRKVWVSNV